MTQNETRRGVWLMIVTTLILAAQDGLSRHLAEATNTPMVVMIRYWFFAAFVIGIALRKKGSVRAAASTPHLWCKPSAARFLRLRLW